MTIRRYGIKPPTIAGRLTPPRPGEDQTAYLRRTVAEIDAIHQELQRFLKYLQDANDTGQTGSGITGITGGVMDHGALAGLVPDDDHTQYLKEKASGGLPSEIPIHDHTGAAEAGQLDHGASNVAASLLDDDHPQYLTAGRHELLDGARPRRPAAHTHAYAEIVDPPAAAAADTDDVVSRRAPLAHTHAYAEIVDPPATAAADADDVVSRRAPLSHTHSYAEIMDPPAAAAAVDEGSLILAARYFGG